MLSNERRTQLDQIVAQMTDAKETDATIQFVVDDFKSKYEDETPTQPEGRDILGKLSKGFGAVFGGGKIGEAIGTQIAKAQATPEEREFITPGPTAKELTGDVASTLAGLFPFTKVGATALTAGKLATRVGKTAALGGVIGAGEAAKEDTGIVSGAITGAGVGGAIPVVGKGLSVIGQQIKGLPDKFVRSALGRSKAEILKDITGKPEKSLSQFVLRKKKVGTANNLITNANTDISSLNKKIVGGLEKVPVTKDKITNKSILQKVVDQVNEEGGSVTEKEVRDIVTKLAPQAKGLLAKPSMGLKKGNSLRSSLDKTLGDRAFLGTQLTFNKDVLRKFTNLLRQEVKSKGPKGTETLFEELSNNIRMRDALLDRVAKQGGNQVLSFGDFIGGGLGGIFGGGFGGAVAGVATRRAIESVPFKTGLGVGLDALIGKATPILESLAPAERAIILNLIKASQQASPESKQQ